MFHTIILHEIIDGQWPCNDKKFINKIIWSVHPKCRYVRVVKETDSKSVGLCLRRFESCCRRFIFFSSPVFLFLFSTLLKY